MEGHIPSFGNREVLSQLMSSIHSRCDAAWWQDLRACLPHLAQLVEQSGDEPIHHLRPQVYMILQEHCTGSDRPDGEPDAHALSRQVSRVLEAMRQLRLEQQHAEIGGLATVPPLMCG